MSVPKGKRTESKLQVLVELQTLCVYTIQICKNEKNFPKRDRWILTQHIVKAATDAYALARKANAVRVVTMEDYKYRRGCQVECKSCLEALLGMIDIAYISLNLESERVEFWTRQVISAEEKLSAWRSADRKRYREILDDGSAEKARP